MQGKDTIISTLCLLFRPIFNERFFQRLSELNADKYVKKLTTKNLIQLFVLAQLEQQQSLRDISNSLNSDELSQSLNLESISAAQLSRRIRDLSPKIIDCVFKNVILQAGKELGFEFLPEKIGRFYLIDSSTISLSLTKYPWAKFRKTKSGVKLHLCLKFVDGKVLPENAVITNAKKADKTQMDDLVIEEENALNVYDRAYVDYEKADRYCENNIRFVSRLKRNALVTIVEQQPIQSGTNVKKDQTVYLGKENFNKMKHPLRLVEVEDTKGNPVIIVTNDFNLKAEEISDIYRYRWQIELFFKWIKQHFRVKHFYGLSQQAVEKQLYIALITYCLLMIIKCKASYNGSLLTIKRILHTCLFDSFAKLVKKLYKKRKHSSKGRRKIPNYETIYQETERQVTTGEVEHLYDTTYDPVIL
ncbi:MAG: IS4 family transposase [Clostridia bacterium]|nr:IS4 family transposase [Clostridia bacterium]MDD4049074.1 IS4 family transposase [Clostridia bacterium]